MGGRKAHEDRKNGYMKTLGYRSLGYFNVTVNGVSVKAKLIEADTKITGGTTGMPLFSNSSDPIYVMVNAETGYIERFRIYENYHGILDLEFHGLDGSAPFKHEHILPPPSETPLPKMSKKEKRKKENREARKKYNLHDGDHPPISKEHQETYKELIDLLGKYPKDLPNFIQRK